MRTTITGVTSRFIPIPDVFMASSSEERLSPEKVITVASSTDMGSVISTMVGIERPVSSRKSRKFFNPAKTDSIFPNMLAMMSSTSIAERQ